MQLRRKRTLALVVNSKPYQSDRSRLVASTLLITCAAALLSGCTLMPLKRFQPVIAPPNAPACTRDQFSFLLSESRDEFHYELPVSAASANEFIARSNTPTGPLFDSYYATVRTAVQAKLPPGLQQHKVTNAFLDLMISASGEAQLDAQIADGTLNTDRNSGQITDERNAIRRHKGPDKLTHGEMKDFADKLFDLQLKPGAAPLTPYSVNTSGLSDSNRQFVSARSFDQTFIKYFEAYYNGKFVDRLGTSLDKPKISSTVPDSEIVAAETVLLEFLIDAIDSTPVMGDTATVTANTNFYPGKFTSVPTANMYGLAKYVQIPTDHTACGITTTNAWVLSDLANAASGQAAAVGGLVANTPGGISFGLGVLGKISIGDNQTLSVMVKTAASRVALRATLASSYWTLRHVKFDVSEP